MKAFVSYSFNDGELYILTLLFEQLRKSGYVVETSTFGYTSGYNLNSFQIQSSDIFLGIITNDSASVNHVISEWNIAKQNNIRSILIIENGVNIHDPNSLSFVRFNRTNPTPAINQLFNINKPVPQTKTNSGAEDALVVGGIIVGIAALIALLSGGGKK